MYKFLLKPILFLFSPEKAHYTVMGLLNPVVKIPGIKWLLEKVFYIEHPDLKRQLFGITFKNPVGLAAGFDKDGKFLNALSPLGFGFIEVGTVTPRPQNGNPKPRLFRLPASRALINRMGFNNDGASALASRLRTFKREDLVIGGNIGKNKDTPNEQAITDYLYCLETLHDHVDYFVVNVSSPNTPGLRDLQEKKPLLQLLQTLQAANSQKSDPKPILLKIAPDLTDGQLDDVIDIAQSIHLDGIIATNTTIARSGLKESAEMVKEIGNGGLSGAPLRERSTEVIRYLAQKTGGKIPLIAAGGICSALDAKEKLEAGASLIQVYTGMIYEGPILIKRINKALLKEH